MTFLALNDYGRHYFSYRSQGHYLKFFLICRRFRIYEKFIIEAVLFFKLLKYLNTVSHTCRIRLFVRNRHKHYASFQCSVEGLFGILLKQSGVYRKPPLHVCHSSAPDPFSGFKVSLGDIVQRHLAQHFLKLGSTCFVCPRLRLSIFFCGHHIEVAAEQYGVFLLSL